MHSRATRWLATIGALIALLVSTACDTGPKPRVKVVETGPLEIDGIYRSMAGPFDRIGIDPDEIDWLAAYKTIVVDTDEDAKMGDEFFCHSQLQLLNGTRLMVTATGAEEVRFPKGFAMPVGEILEGLPSEQRYLTMLGMVLNNHEPRIDRTASIRATLEYFTDEDLGDPPQIRKLYKASVTMQVEDLAEYHPEGASTDVTTHCSVLDEGGYHWVVPPGPQLTKKQWTEIVPVDGTVHYATGHMHNFGKYMRLINVTTGEELWRTDVAYERSRDQIEKIPVYSSEKGFPVYRDHVYEIEAYYDNTSGVDVDAMAQIDLYYEPSVDVKITYPVGPDE